MYRTAAVLKRYAAIVGDAPLPKKAEDLSGEQRMKIAKADPELAAILFGTASATLEASVLDGSFSESYTAPSDEQINAEEVSRLIADGAFPTPGRYLEDGSYQEPTAGSLTAQLRIAQLDPARYQAELAKIQASAPAIAQQVDDSQTRINSLNASRGMG